MVKVSPASHAEKVSHYHLAADLVTSSGDPTAKRQQHAFQEDAGRNHKTSEQIGGSLGPEANTSTRVNECYP